MLLTYLNGVRPRALEHTAYSPLTGCLYCQKSGQNCKHGGTQSSSLVLLTIPFDAFIFKTLLTLSSPECHKNPVQRCVDLGHMHKCPRHPWVYCLDKEGKTCVLCVEADKRFERVQLQAKRVVRETQVAAALDVRADTRAAKKVRWDDKLPTVDKLARTGANKAQQASKTANAQNTENNKGGRAWNGAKGGSVVKVQQTEGSKAYAEQDKVKAKPKLRIQRGR